jgi:hypothetical protein
MAAHYADLYAEVLAKARHDAPASLSALASVDRPAATMQR